MVHSDLSKAESWMRLTEEFLNSPLPNTDGVKVSWTFSPMGYRQETADGKSDGLHLMNTHAL